MNKKITSILLSIILLLSMSLGNTAIASSDISVKLNGSTLSFDVPPKIINGRTMVPMRKIFESLGAVVNWDQASQTVTGKKGDTIINITVNSKTLFKNGVPKLLDVPPAVVESRILVPVRAIAESFDCQVLWHQDTHIVEITTNGGLSLEKTTLSASDVSEKVSPSVFYIEVYDEKSNILGSGSGFFISNDGVAVTNYHVIEETAGGQITTINGDKFNISNIIAYDKELDVAIIKVGKITTTGKTVTGFSSVTMSDSDKIKAGQTIYAIGSPVGLQNTISNGIISNVKQKIGDETFIQITAPISHGSSGGALVNEFGEVLGITSSGIDGAQNIGFAIPINVIKMFDITAKGITYEEFASESATFTLLVEPQVIELEVGESKEILVYAEGKGDDWSIYWNTEETNLVNCEWGDWLEDYNNVCPLTINAIREGTATITIYSDVDFKGVDITVYIKKPRIETYPNSCVPTYTAITGVPILEHKTLSGGSDLYKYKLYDAETPSAYIEYILSNGFKYYDKKTDEYGAQYFYIAPDGKMFSFSVEVVFNQIWIIIGK